MIAYCYVTGEIFFGKRAPAGVIPIVKGRAAIVRAVVSGGCRHAYDGTTLLVPGVPEAENDAAAMAALAAFRDRMATSYKRAVASLAAMRAGAEPDAAAELAAIRPEG